MCPVFIDRQVSIETLTIPVDVVTLTQGQGSMTAQPAIQTDQMGHVTMDLCYYNSPDIPG